MKTLNFLEELTEATTEAYSFEVANRIRDLAFYGRKHESGLYQDVSVTNLPTPSSEFLDFLIQSTGFLDWDDHEEWETKDYFKELIPLVRYLIENKIFSNLESDPKVQEFLKLRQKTSEEFFSRNERANTDVLGW